MKNAKPQVELVSKKNNNIYLHTNINVDVYIAGKKSTLHCSLIILLCSAVVYFLSSTTYIGIAPGSWCSCSDIKVYKPAFCSNRGVCRDCTMSID